MNIDSLRKLCLSFPGATEKVTWGADLTFRVAEKIFAVTVLEVHSVWLTFKCSDETFAELIERPNIIPAPYLARAEWVALETKAAIPDAELASLLRTSYDLVVAKLPAKLRNNLTAAKASTRRRKLTPKPKAKRRSSSPTKKKGRPNSEMKQTDRPLTTHY
jgi:predicted DNA-binding protein (MmcQ/YjbR family)